MRGVKNDDPAEWDLLASLGESLRLLREQEGFTQRAAAKQAESTQARISDLENGKADVFILTLRRWAQVYGYDVEVHFVPIEQEEIAECQTPSTSPET